MAAKLFGLLFILCIAAVAPLSAQTIDMLQTESGPADGLPNPIDDVVESSITAKKRVLPYDQPREADIFWKKRIWRIIDVREKMNLPFAYPKRPFVTILLEAINNKEKPLRIFQDEEFKTRLDTSAVNGLLYKIDTVLITDPVTYEQKQQIIKSEVNITEDVQRIRVKEIWFFDKESSTMQVRILGIAPVLPVKTSTGDKVGENVLFWIYYPDARETLAREKIFNEANDGAPMTWEDVFEMRYFSSYIYKASNVKDLRLQDQYTGRDLLLEAEKIKQEIFNMEHDLWTY
ncbi:gliding motility protein GldN [Haliscomenobacter sp.]|uniref:type IX secretion system ring protein PorN/GldN n=1 Tax=Haliscomenobacter sp. TaxID=2717303 RepID=UPI003364D44C